MSTLSGGPNIVTRGLVLYLDAANPNSYVSGSTTWLDLTTNGYNGTLQDGPTYNSQNSGIIQFDGVNDMIRISNSVTPFTWTADGTAGMQNMTIEMWFKTSDTAGVLYTKPFNGNGQYNIWIQPAQWCLACGTSANIYAGCQTFTSINTANGLWNQIVVWADSTNKGYYINGNQYTGSQSHGQTGGIASDGNNTGVGLMTLFPYGPGWAGDTGFSISGSLAITKVYNRVLSASEVLQNYNSQKSRFGLT